MPLKRNLKPVRKDTFKRIVSDQKLIKAYLKPHFEEDDGIPDALNPHFTFSLTPIQILSLIIRDKIDAKVLARRMMANHGRDEMGNWVGFKEAEKLHKTNKRENHGTV